MEPRHKVIGRIEDEDTFLRITLSTNIHGETLLALTVGDIDARRRDHVLALNGDQFDELKALFQEAQEALNRLARDDSRDGLAP